MDLQRQPISEGQSLMNLKADGQPLHLAPTDDRRVRFVPTLSVLTLALALALAACGSADGRPPVQPPTVEVRRIHQVRGEGAPDPAHRICVVAAKRDHQPVWCSGLGFTTGGGPRGGWNIEFDEAIGRVLSADLSAEGKVLAVASVVDADQYRVSVFEIGGRKATASWDAPYCTVVAVNGNGTRIAGRNGGDGISVWGGTGHQQVALPAPGAPTALAFIPYSNLLVSGDGLGNVIVWDLANGRRVAECKANSIVDAMAVSPHGTWIATNDGTSDLLIFEAASGQCLWRLGTASDGVTVLAFDEAEGLILAGYADGSIRVWSLLDGAIVIRCREHEGAVTSARFLQGDMGFITGGKDGSVILWRLKIHEHLGPMRQLVPASDGRLTWVQIQAAEPEAWRSTLDTAVGDPESITHLIRDRLETEAERYSPTAVEALITLLDDDNPERRDAAESALVGLDVQNVLEAALAKGQDPEKRSRIEHLLRTVSIRSPIVLGKGPWLPWHRVVWMVRQVRPMRMQDLVRIRDRSVWNTVRLYASTLSTN